ncbi:MAG: helix-turn-helix transcriptional regulator [Treponema sp.]|nr:helix-turn-helix transcriptional regulator [Treponema sp.]
MNFWSRVQSILDSKGLSRKELAIEVGIDLSNIGKGIKQGNLPSVETALKIATFLNVPIEYLTQDYQNEPKIQYEIHKNPQFTDIASTIDKLSDDQKKNLVHLIRSLSENYSPNQLQELLEKAKKE